MPAHYERFVSLRLRRFSAPKVHWFAKMLVLLGWITSISIVALVPIDVWATLKATQNHSINIMWSISYWCPPPPHHHHQPQIPADMKCTMEASHGCMHPHGTVMPYMTSVLQTLCTISVNHAVNENAASHGQSALAEVLSASGWYRVQCLLQTAKQRTPY